MRCTCKWAGSICSWISHVDSHQSSSPSTQLPLWQADHTLSQYHFRPADHLLDWSFLIPVLDGCVGNGERRGEGNNQSQIWCSDTQAGLWAFSVEHSSRGIAQGTIKPSLSGWEGGPSSVTHSGTWWLQLLLSWSLSPWGTTPPVYTILVVEYGWIMSPVSLNTFNICLANKILAPWSVFKTLPGGAPHSWYESHDNTQSCSHNHQHAPLHPHGYNLTYFHLCHLLRLLIPSLTFLVRSLWPHHYWFEVIVCGSKLGVCLFVFSIRSSAPWEETL